MAEITIKAFVVGPVGTNCYVVSSLENNQAVVIDPGAQSGLILDYLSENGLSVSAVLLTHTHFDHITALPAITAAHNCPVYVHPLESANTITKLADQKLIEISDGDTVAFGENKFTVLHTPGHTPGSVVFRIGDILFTGDTLFKDSMGRTDLGGNTDDIMKSLRRLSALEGDYAVLPGHDEQTTLSRERRYNYYVRYANRELPAFMDIDY